MLTAGESSSVHTCLSFVPRLLKIQPLPFPKALPAMAVPQRHWDLPTPAQGHWSRVGPMLMRLSNRNSDLDNVFYISIKGAIAFSSLSFSYSV